MRAVVQRVSQASVTVEGEVVGKIDRGLLVLLGVEKNDDEDDLRYMVDKTSGLRVFEDENDKMNLSLLDVGGSMLVVSQFTLLGDCRRGKRPSFIEAAPPDVAEQTYQRFVENIRSKSINVECGRFRTHMHVELVNDGPVTILLESKKLL